MPREVEPSLNERAFVTQALQEGQRLDGRAFDQFRKLDLKFGDQYGVADVSLGKTRYAMPYPKPLYFCYLFSCGLDPLSTDKHAL
jgi:exosome complex RNA-binding protein Rrp42 (RNase PH superfamily)